MHRHLSEVEVSYSAGCLKHYIQAWSRLTSDSFVLACVQGYKIQFLHRPYQVIPSRMSRRQGKDVLYMHQEIDRLLGLGAIRRCEPCDGQFLSSCFLVPKPNGAWRFVLNLKELNTFIGTDHFIMEDCRTAQRLLSRDCYMATIDLQDAYYLVPMHEESCKFLRFEWDNVLFEFTVRALLRTVDIYENYEVGSQLFTECRLSIGCLLGRLTLPQR